MKSVCCIVLVQRSVFPQSVLLRSGVVLGQQKCGETAALSAVCETNQLLKCCWEEQFCYCCI